jgi:hypothetical protein
MLIKSNKTRWLEHAARIEDVGKIIQSVVEKSRISHFSATNEKRTQHGMSQNIWYLS